MHDDGTNSLNYHIPKQKYLQSDILHPCSASSCTAESIYAYMTISSIGQGLNYLTVLWSHLALVTDLIIVELVVENLCLNLGEKTPAYMSPVEPGSLFQQITENYLPPPSPPLPVLTDNNVTEPPLSSPAAAPAPTPAWRN